MRPIILQEPALFETPEADAPDPVEIPETERVEEDSPLESAQEAAALELPVIEASKAPLLTLDEAVERVPESLRKEMAELLRAEFREVRRWTPPKTKA